jgi:hypothetical protein
MTTNANASPIPDSTLGEEHANAHCYFLIDHPLDPDKKQLLHASVAGPERTTLYAGNVITNVRGEALVELPAYFETLNAHPRYQLTPIGRAAPNLHVREEIKENRFVIGGALPYQRISWTVTAVRKDALALRRPFEAEVEKKEGEHGLYRFPEAYDLPPEKGIMYQRLLRRLRRDGGRP